MQIHNAVPIEGESLVKASSHSLNYLLAADEWQWQASTTQCWMRWQIWVCCPTNPSMWWQICVWCVTNPNHLWVKHIVSLSPPCQQAGGSPTKCHCNNVSVCPACKFELVESEQQDFIGIAIVSSKTFTPCNSCRPIYPNILVERIEILQVGSYLEVLKKIFHYRFMASLHSAGAILPPHWN